MEKLEPEIYTAGDACSFPITIRSKDSPLRILPVIKSTSKILVIQDWVRVQAEYVIYNDQDSDITPLLVVNRLPKALSESVKAFKNTNDISGASTILQVFDKKVLFDEKSEHHITVSMGKGANWTVQYVFFMELIVEELTKEEDENLIPTGVQKLNFELPSSFYQIPLEVDEVQIEEVLAAASKLNFEFTKIGDDWVAPWDIVVDEVRSTFPVQLESNREENVNGTKFSSKNEGEEVIRKFGISFQRTFQPEDFKYQILEKEEKDNSYYLYLKSFPIQEFGFKEKTTLFKEVFDRTFLFTIVILNGSEMTAIGSIDKARDYACQLIDSLPDDCKFRVVYLPLLEGDYPSEYLEPSDENKEAAKNEINEKVTKVVCEFSNMEKYIETIAADEEDEFEPPRYVVLGGSSYGSDVGVKNALLKALPNGGRKRFYYISMEETIQSDLAWNFFIHGSGIGVTTKDEFNISENVEYVMKNAVGPFTSSIKYQFENFDDLIKPFVRVEKEGKIFEDGVALNEEFLKKVRTIKNNLEYFGKIQDGTNHKLPNDFGLVLSYEFDGSSTFNNFSFDLSKAIVLKNEQHHFYLSQIYDLQYQTMMNNKKKGSGICGSANKKDDGTGVMKIAFEFIYGGKSLGELLFDDSTTMESVKDTVIQTYPEVTNFNDSDWTSGGNKIDFSKKLSELENDKVLFPTIDIKKLDGSAEAKVSQIIASKFNKEKLFEFDPKLITDRLKFDKNVWQTYEKAILANEAKFKGQLSAIKAGTPRNLVFSLFCIAYLTKKCAGDVKDYDDKVKKVKANLKSSYSYDDQFQTDAEACMGVLIA